MKGLSLTEPMVKAWMEGRKTLTRRLMNPQPPVTGDNGGRFVEVVPSLLLNRGDLFDFRYESDNPKALQSRYLPGETVYIQETWRETWCSGSPGCGYEVGIEYRCKLGDGYGKTVKVPEMHYGYKVTKKGNPAWRSPRFMPERAARSHALIVSVRPERVQEITEEDAIREGVKADPVMIDGVPPVRYFCRDSFRRVWMNLHPGSWARNDWAWRIEMEKL